MRNVLPSKLILLCFCLLYFSNSGYSQSVSPEVIGSAGDHFATGNVQLSWTVGEPMTQTLGTGSTILTQGFHQPSSIIDSREELSPIESRFSFVIYPNPAKDNATLEITGDFPHNAVLVLYDLYGRTHSTIPLTQQSTTQKIDLSELAAGPYFVKIRSSEGILFTDKIEIIR